ncbi:hypothetical protein J6590_088187 [Homalodisca vitripennis]|nr:hypothetical protein J6590_088187 [Homalodisca vitripennis]
MSELCSRSGGECGTPTYVEYPLKTFSNRRILAWKQLIALNFRLGLILTYAQKARTFLAVRILDLSRIPVQITLFGADTSSPRPPSSGHRPCPPKSYRKFESLQGGAEESVFRVAVRPEVAVTTQKHCDVVIHLAMPPYYPRLDLFDKSGSPTSTGVLLPADLPLLVRTRALLSPCSVFANFALPLINCLPLSCHKPDGDDSSNNQDGSSDVHQYETRGRDNFRIVQHRTSGFEHLPSQVGVKLINKLPEGIKHLIDSKLFKSRLKHLLASKAFYSVEEFMLKWITGSLSQSWKEGKEDTLTYCSKLLLQVKNGRGGYALIFGLAVDIKIKEDY